MHSSILEEPVSVRVSLNCFNNDEIQVLHSQTDIAPLCAFCGHSESFQMVLHSDSKSDGAVQKSPTLIQNSTALLCFIDVDTDCCVSRLTCRKVLCHQFVKKR